MPIRQRYQLQYQTVEWIRSECYINNSMFIFLENFVQQWTGKSTLKCKKHNELEKNQCYTLLMGLVHCISKESRTRKIELELVFHHDILH